ncbi:hypothetical protein Hdeb2414_s0002g00049571 [Helianthus debilis subsp. tardiflorus]
MGDVLGGNAPDVGGSTAGVIEGTPSAKKGSSMGSEDSQHSPPMEDVSSGDEYLGTRLSWKRKPDPVVDVNVVIPEPRSILNRLRSASPQKSQPTSRAASQAPLVNTKGSLLKHLKILRPSSSLVSGPFLGSFKAPIMISTAHATSQAKRKGLETSATPIDPIFGASPVQATGQSRFKLPEYFRARTPLAPFLSMMEKTWEREQAGWLAERERLLTDVKHYNDVFFVSVADLDVLYVHLGIAQEDSQKLAAERHWLSSLGFGLFLSAFSQSEEYKGSLERIYRAYRDMGYQVGLKDGYSYSFQGMKRKETPNYNSKAKKHLAKLDEEFNGKTPALIAKISNNPLMSLDELKSLLDPASPVFAKSPSRDGSPGCLKLRPSADCHRKLPGGRWFILMAAIMVAGGGAAVDGGDGTGFE